MVALVDKVPQEFICPISHEIMKKAMITNCNHSFDEESLKLSKQIKNLCPLDRKPIINLRPNAELQGRISVYKQNLEPRDFHYCMKEIGKFFLGCFNGMPEQVLYLTLTPPPYF